MAALFWFIGVIALTTGIPIFFFFLFKPQLPEVDIPGLKMIMLGVFLALFGIFCGFSSCLIASKVF